MNDQNFSQAMFLTFKTVVNSPLTGAMVLLIWFLIENPEISGLNTVLLTGAVGLLAWSLVTTVVQSKKLTEIVIALKGYDGKGGLLTDVRDLKSSKEKQEIKISELEGKLKQINGEDSDG